MPNKPVPAAGRSMPAPSSLICYQSLPHGRVTFMVRDGHSMPFIRPGEWVVVDTTDTTPRDGDVYVIEWDSGKRDLCQASISRTKFLNHDGSTVWTVHSIRRMDSEQVKAWFEAQRNNPAGGAAMFPGGWTEGWFDITHLSSKLVGAVIGIFQPNFEGPLRTVTQGDKA